MKKILNPACNNVKEVPNGICFMVYKDRNNDNAFKIAFGIND